VTNDSESRLPLPDVVNWPNFPFEGDLHVKAVEPYDEVEEPRNGEHDTADCEPCGAPDSNYLWTDDTWRLKSLAPFSPLPVSLILETRDHTDLRDFDRDRASQLGVLMVELTNLTESMGEVGRLHTYRWGDGAKHFHIWFLGRPIGAAQLRGLTLPFWGLTLPPLAEEITDPINEAIANHLSSLAL